MTEMWLRGADGYLVVYTVTRLGSFHEVQYYLERIERTRDDSPNNIPITIFANKVDLVNEREVSSDDGMSFASLNGVCYLEGSAKERINIEEAFDGLVRIIKKSRKPQENKAQRKTNICTVL